MVVITCNICVRRGSKKPFKSEYTDDGAVLMKEHLAKHREKGEE